MKGRMDRWKAQRAAVQTAPRSAAASEEPQPRGEASVPNLALSRGRSESVCSGAGSAGSAVTGGGAGLGLGVEVEILVARTAGEPLGLAVDYGTCTVDSVEDRSPAGRAGVEVGMQILRCNGRAVATFEDVRAAIGAAPAGSEVALVVRDPRVPNSRHLMVIHQNEYIELLKKHDAVRTAEREEAAVEAKAVKHAATMKKAADQSRAAAQSKASDLKKLRDQVAKSQVAQAIVALQEQLRESEAQNNVAVVNYKQTEGAIVVSIKNMKGEQRRFQRLLGEEVGEDEEDDNEPVITGDGDIKLRIQLHQLAEELKARHKVMDKRKHATAHLDAVLQNKTARVKATEQKTKDMQQALQRAEADRERLAKQNKQLAAERARKDEEYKDAEKRMAGRVNVIEQEKERKLGEIKALLSRERDTETASAKRISDIQIATQTLKAQQDLLQREHAASKAEEERIDQSEQHLVAQIKEGTRFNELWRKGQIRLCEIGSEVAKVGRERSEAQVAIEEKHKEMKRLASLISERAAYLQATKDTVADLDNEREVTQNNIRAYEPAREEKKKLEEGIAAMEAAYLEEHRTAVALTQEAMEEEREVAEVGSRRQAVRVHIARLAAQVQNAEEEHSLRQEERDAVARRHRDDQVDLDTDAAIAARKVERKAADLTRQLQRAETKSNEGQQAVAMLRELFPDAPVQDDCPPARTPPADKARSCVNILRDHHKLQTDLGLLEEKLDAAHKLTQNVLAQEQERARAIEHKTATLEHFIEAKEKKGDPLGLVDMLGAIRDGIAILTDKNAALKLQLAQHKA